MSAVPGDDSFIWRDHAGLCYSQTSQNIQRIFRHSSSIGWVCLFAAGGEGGGRICESIEIPTSLCLYSIGFEIGGDLPDGNLFSVCVLFTLALT